MQGVILDGDSLYPDDIQLQPLGDALDRLSYYPATTPDQVGERLAGHSVVLTNKVELTAEHFAANPQLKLVVILATGTNNVDLAAAGARGVLVCNCVDYSTASVVQHTLMLMLALSTRLLAYDRDVRAGRWQGSPFFCLADHPIVELAGKTLVIVGYGALGKGVARAAQGLGMQVEIAARPGAFYSDGSPPRLPWPEALRQADVLSLHCPLSEQTRQLIDGEALSQMKPGALLINTARGGLVEERALVQALREGRLAGAGVDVLSAEPPREGNPLLAQDIPNLIVTPHSAWASREARQRLVIQAAAVVSGFFKGEIINRVSER